MEDWTYLVKNSRGLYIAKGGYEYETTRNPQHAKVYTGQQVSDGVRGAVTIVYNPNEDK